MLRADSTALLGAAAERLGESGLGWGWRERWEVADALVEEVIANVLVDHGARSEPGIARELFAALPAGATLVCSSSMPVRDVEWFAAPRHGAPRVLANRGANGIDGVTSTVLGAAAAAAAAGDGPVVGLTGDLAFFHDLSALVWGRHEERPAALLVVVDNGGGGIFDFLDYPGVVEPQPYERLFGTPQSADVAAVATAFGIPVLEADEAGDLAELVGKALAGGSLTVIRCRTERASNVALHARRSEETVAMLDSRLS